LAQKETPRFGSLDQWIPLPRNRADGTLWETASNEKYIGKAATERWVPVLGNPAVGEPGMLDVIKQQTVAARSEGVYLEMD
jgi:hypothetical protein